MTSNISSITSSKRQRIMIVTADESIIDQIGKTNNLSILTQIIPDCEADSDGSNNQQIKKQTSQKTTKTSHGSLTCVVCGSRAKGFNFGAISCESCKAFFRRNALKHSIVDQCRNKGNCEITSELRRNCSACRLTKCFNSGMERDRLLTRESKVAKLHAIEENRNLTSTLNSTATGQQTQMLPTVFTDDLLTTIDTDLLLFTDFIDLLSPQPQPQPKQILLSSEDLQRIETISHLYKKRIELAANDGLPWDPSIHTINFLQNLNSQSVPIMRLLSFFKQLPEFNQLNVDDKVTLIKYNIITVLGISCSLSYNTERNQVIETDSDAPRDRQFTQLVHGYNFCMEMQKIFKLFIQIAKYDEKIIQLTLITLILTKGFSTTDINEPILNDEMAVYHVQSYYTELLWKYMESVHGSEKAIRLFSELMVHVLSWQTIQEQFRSNVLRILSPTDIDELLPIIKSVLHIS